MVDFKQKLAHILQKYPFIHIDRLGELSIIVPLTGARKITNNFSDDTNNPINLYMFGDNTCKSDLERRKFFSDGKDHSSFQTLYPQLIKELQQLQSETTISEEDYIFLQAMIINLDKDQKNARFFETGNPAYNEMRDDLHFGTSIFIAKGEFLVKVDPDGLRHLNLPNIMGLAHSALPSSQKIICQELKDSILDTLSCIKSDKNVDYYSLIPAIVEQIPDIRDYLQQKNNKSPLELFAKIYQSIQNQGFTLENQLPEVFENMQVNWGYICDEEDNLDTWTKIDINDAITSVFKNADILKKTGGDEYKTFEVLYQQVMRQFADHYITPKNGNDRHKDTYQLFVLQTFLYLCAINLRLKNAPLAKNFLKIFDNKKATINLITSLCLNESTFKQMMLDTFQLQPTEYQLIIDATYEIVTDHLEAVHFDELRIACTPELLQNTHYIIMGGRLCWSTTPITEACNLNSLQQQKMASDSHFELFYSDYLKKYKIFQLIKRLLSKDLNSEKLNQQILSHMALLSTTQKEQILLNSINEKKYKEAQFLISNADYEFSSKIFMACIRQMKDNDSLIVSLLGNSERHALKISGEHIIQAIEYGKLDLVQLLLEKRPDLLEYKNRFQETPLLIACKLGKADIVQYLMKEGANIHCRSIVPSNYIYKMGEIPFGGRSTKDWVKNLEKDHMSEAIKIKSLFDNYYPILEKNFISDPTYKDKFTADHLSQAITGGDLKLINLLLKYCPTLKLKNHDLDKAKYYQTQNKLHSQIMPYQEQFNKVLETLERKRIDQKGVHSSKLWVISKLNNKLSKARNIFFNNEMTPETFKQFDLECKKALEESKPLLAKHHGWHKYPVFMRAILGILAIIAVVPAWLIISKTENKCSSYIELFFKSKKNVQTDSVKKLKQLEDVVESLKGNISTDVKNTHPK